MKNDSKSGEFRAFVLMVKVCVIWFLIAFISTWFYCSKNGDAFCGIDIIFYFLAPILFIHLFLLLLGVNYDLSGLEFIPEEFGSIVFLLSFVGLYFYFFFLRSTFKNKNLFGLRWDKTLIFLSLSSVFLWRFFSYIKDSSNVHKTGMEDKNVLLFAFVVMILVLIYACSIWISYFARKKLLKKS